MRRKLFSIILSLAMVLTMMPMTAFAETQEDAWKVDVYVKGVQITSDNCTDILGDGIEAVTYEKSTKTLTLNGAEINWEGSSDFIDKGVITSREPLNIQVLKSSTIRGTNCCPIYVDDADLNITGSGKLILNSSTNYGIKADNLTNKGILSCNIGFTTAIYVDNFVNSGTVSISSKQTGIDAGSFVQTGGKTTINVQVTDAYDENIPKSFEAVYGIIIGDSGSFNEGFHISGGELTVTAIASKEVKEVKGHNENEIKSIGIEIEDTPAIISGGKVKISVGSGPNSLGMICIGSEPYFTGGDTTVIADGEIVDETEMYATVLYSKNQVIPSVPVIGESISSSMKVFASYNADGSSQVATYNPDRVMNGYRYLRIASPVKLKSISLSKKTFYCTGKSQGPAVTVKDASGKTVSTANYTIKGTKKAAKPGTYKITATGKGLYGGSVSGTYKIKVKPTKIVSLTKGSRSFNVKVSKLSSKYATGYQVKYSLNKSMKKATIKTVGKKSTAVKKTVKNLKKNKRYYVQVRTYKTVSGKKYYSSWSAKKSVKTK